MNALDDYLVDPKLSLLDETRIQAQVLVPVLRALRSELGKEKADAGRCSSLFESAGGGTTLPSGRCLPRS